MDLPFLLLAVLTIASAIAAMSLRNLVHCALCLIVTFVCIAGLFLKLNAQFVGFAQILVYVGAVAILIVFAILLTRGAELPAPAVIARSPWTAVGLALAAFGVIALAILKGSGFRRLAPPPADVTVEKIGQQLMHEYVLPLEVIGLLLTAAMIGAVIVAMHEKRK
jgi:NADH-quinone oxidoreductase subunit J